ncbi:hypothetical protein F5Y14DRAFT_420627 [Nemania sp. NC0429]|nr:hypothetical protein F5Y14DRAFT_420627 [Nemania sp. NC0429]
MVAQLPDGALAAVVGVQIYSYVCLLSCVLMILLVWKHHERTSYVALLCYSAFISIIAIIGSQLYNIVHFEDVKRKQYHNILYHGESCPETSITGGAIGPDREFAYLQFYAYSVAAVLTLIWALVLAYSIFHPSERIFHRRISRKSSILAKSLAVIIPLVITILMRVPAINASAPAYLTLGNLTLGTSLIFRSIFLAAILYKHIQTRRKLNRWIVRSPVPGTLNEEGGEDPWDSNSRESIYDKWLTVRLFIALLFIGGFQVLTILYEISWARIGKKEFLPPEPDFSAAVARKQFINYIPAASPGLLLLLVFGTTETCIRTMRSWFVPRMFRRETEPTITPASTTTPLQQASRSRTLSTASSLWPSHTRSLELGP